MWKPLYKARKVQLVYRMLCSWMLLFMLISDPICLKSLKYLEFFTIWTLIMTNATFILLIAHYFSYKKNKKSLFHQYLWRIALVVFTLSITWEATLTLIFWAVLRKDDPKPFFENIKTFNYNFDHILPLSFLVIDFITNKYLLIMTHLVFTILYAIIYVLFNCILVLEFNQKIYSILTFKDWETATWIAAMFSIAIVSHVTFVLISRCKTSKYDAIVNAAQKTHLVSKSINDMKFDDTKQTDSFHS